MKKEYSVFQNIKTEQKLTECMDTEEQALIFARFQKNIHDKKNAQIQSKKKPSFGILKIAAILAIVLLTGTTGVALAARSELLQKWHDRKFANYELPELPDGVDPYWGEPIHYKYDYQMGNNPKIEVEGTILGYHMDANGLLYLVMQGGYLPSGINRDYVCALNGGNDLISCQWDGVYGSDKENKLTLHSALCTINDINDTVDLYEYINRYFKKFEKKVKLGTFHVTDPACKIATDEKNNQIKVSRFGIIADKESALMQRIEKYDSHPDSEENEPWNYVSPAEREKQYHFTFWYKDGSSDKVRLCGKRWVPVSDNAYINYAKNFANLTEEEKKAFTRSLLEFQSLTGEGAGSYCFDPENLIKITDEFGWEFLFTEE